MLWNENNSCCFTTQVVGCFLSICIYQIVFVICHSLNKHYYQHTHFLCLYSCQNTSLTRNVSRKEKWKQALWPITYFIHYSQQYVWIRQEKSAIWYCQDFCIKQQWQHISFTMKSTRNAITSTSHFTNFLSKMHNHILQIHNLFLVTFIKFWQGNMFHYCCWLLSSP